VLARAHRAHGDDLAHGSQLDWFVVASPQYGQSDAGVDGAEYFVEHLIDIQSLQRYAFDVGDDIVDLDARLGRRAVVDWRDDPDRTIVLGNFNLETDPYERVVDLHIAEVLRVNVDRFGVEHAGHAIDGCGDEF